MMSRIKSDDEESAEKADDREEREIKNPRFSSKDDDAQFRTV